MSEIVRVFHQPGCSSCLRAKEFVARHGIPFESIDVLHNAEGMDLLRKLGVRRVPVVSKGQQWVFGGDLDQVAVLLGIATRQPDKLSPDVLRIKLDRILAVAEANIQSVPDAQLVVLNPNRESRDLRNLAFHIFDIPVDFLEALNGAEYTQGVRSAPSEIRRGQELADFGGEVRQRIAGWFVTQTPESWRRPIPTLWGEQSVLQLFERVTWHSAQHTRQLEAMLAILGTRAVDHLTEADLEHLPLPERVWE